MAEFATGAAEIEKSNLDTRNIHEIRGHLRGILESPHFVHAHQLQAFLEFLVEAALNRREEELKEYSLGRDVFRRGESYDPRTDSIVRVQASILRKRLAAYYENEGRTDPLRIELHKGSYIPHFVECPCDPEAIPELPAAAGAQPPTPSRRGFLTLAGAFAGGIAATSAVNLLRDAENPTNAITTAAAPNIFDVRDVSPRLWGALLDGSRPIQLAFGCPQFFRGRSLYVRDTHVNAPQTPAADERLRELTRQLETYLTPAPHTYTGVGEILGIHRITQFITYRGIQADLENVQLLTPEAIRNKDLILVSSYRFRTVLDLLALPKAFSTTFDGDGGIVLPNPRPGEEQIYTTQGSGGISRTYGLISFWTKPDTGGRVLSLSGIDSPATLGTVLYLTNRGNLIELEKKFGDEFTADSSGVQVLVEIHGRDDRALNARYVTHRVL